MEELSDGDIETQEASSSLLKMTRERKGFFKFEIAPLFEIFNKKPQIFKNSAHLFTLNYN